MTTPAPFISAVTAAVKEQIAGAFRCLGEAEHIIDREDHSLEWFFTLIEGTRIECRASCHLGMLQTLFEYNG
ncbi:hypothetical protein J23TS9_05810 [Paenibacillus sp. J23TS9]|nr:hypothetical protein J23TS9_05810 [Paenibacillus sp. J23TS9]